jgi:hypothetical protein
VALQDAFAELEVVGPGDRSSHPTLPNRLLHPGARANGVDDAEGVEGAQKSAARSHSGRIAVCPSQRAAMIYVLSEHRSEQLRSDVVRRALQLDGVELAIWLERDLHGAPSAAVIARPSVGELRFHPGGDLRDARAGTWSLEGELAVLAASVRDGVLSAPEYPDALARVWSALTCTTSGEVLLSAAPGYEFLDWGRQAHVGGGSHGSLRGEDSLGALILCGLDFPAEPLAQWSIRDVAPLVVGHFGITAN